MAAAAEEFAEGWQPSFRVRQEGQALLEGAGDQVNVAHVAVEVSHEGLEAPDRRTVRVAEMVRHGRLEAFDQHVRRAVDVVVQFVADPQQKIVGGFELFALAVADQPPFFKFRKRTGPVFEKRHPDQVLEIAQAAAAVLDVRLLHRGRIAELRPPRFLVRQPRLDIVILESAHASRQHHRFHSLEHLLVTGDEPRLDQGGLRLHVAVGDFDAFVHRSHRVAHLQSDVPKRV